MTNPLEAYQTALKGLPEGVSAMYSDRIEIRCDEGAVAFVPFKHVYHVHAKLGELLGFGGDDDVVNNYHVLHRHIETQRARAGVLVTDAFSKDVTAMADEIIRLRREVEGLNEQIATMSALAGTPVPEVSTGTASSWPPSTFTIDDMKKMSPPFPPETGYEDLTRKDPEWGGMLKAAEATSLEFLATEPDLYDGTEGDPVEEPQRVWKDKDGNEYVRAEKDERYPVNGEWFGTDYGSAVRAKKDFVQNKHIILKPKDGGADDYAAKAAMLRDAGWCSECDKVWGTNQTERHGYYYYVPVEFIRRVPIEIVKALVEECKG